MVRTPMVTKNSNSDKGAGRTDYQNDKQAVITIEVPGDGARTVEAQHYIRSDDGTISIYLSDRSEGIDIQTHVTRCVIDRVDTHDDTDVKSGVCDRCSDNPVQLTSEGLCGPCYHLACPGCDTGHVGGHEGNPRCTKECGFFSDDEGDTELVTDGGRRIVAPIVGRNPNRRDTGNSHWCESRCKTVYCGRLECPYCEASDDDQEDGDGDQELVADGGTVIESGDVVTHAGERWRVARSDGARVEIYQLGARSLIVPIDTVEPVPEVRA